MEPKLNDVLSGRGAWFNQHPGNEHFRRMLEEQKAVYMTGTKKQKMDMAKAIVESIYSMEPPGRFLKKCPGEAGEWKELSRREAADKAAQAMAYAIKGESLKEKRRERRRSRLPPSLRPQKDNVVEKSSQSDGRPTNNNHNHLGGVPSSPVARHHGLAARGGSGAAGSTTTNAQSSAVNDDHVDLVADGRMLFPDNSNLSQQLAQQFTPSSSTTTLLTSSGAPPNANQNGLVQVLAQALQQQRRHNLQQQQQQLPLQHTFGQDPLGFETQTLLQSASLEGLTQQLLSQTQQYQYQQQQLLFQHLLNQQNALPSASLPMTTLSLSAPILSAPSPNDFLRGTTSNFSLTGPQSQPANSNLLQYQVHPQSNHPSNALLLSVLSNQPSTGTSIALPRQASELDQVQRSLVRQQQQLLASSLSNPSNNNHLLLQQQLQSLPLHQWQAALQLQHNSQDPPLPSLNNSAAELLLSANHRVDPSSSSREEESGKRRR